MERASLVGEEFWPAALAHLLPDMEPLALGTCLAALVGRGLLPPGGTPFGKEPAFHFSHILMRDVAYEQLLKEDRAELHERIASGSSCTSGSGPASTARSSGITSSAQRGAAASCRRSTSRRAALSPRRRLAHGGRGARRSRGVTCRPRPTCSSAPSELLPAGDPERHQLLPKLGMALAETGTRARADGLFLEWIDAEQRGRALLVYRDGDGQQHVFDLDAAGAEVTIGRRTSNDVALAWDTEVSREHAVLERGRTAGGRSSTTGAPATART